MAAVTGLTATYQSGDDWVITWDAGSASAWEVWIDGVQALVTTEPQARVRLDTGATVDVLEAGDEPGEAYPRRITLAWWAVATASTYRIEEYVDAAWTWRQTIKATDAPAYTWTSRVLEDETDHSFRIVAYDTAGNAGSAETLDFRMVRIPDPPTVTVEIEGGQEDPPGTFYATATITAT